MRHPARCAAWCCLTLLCLGLARAPAAYGAGPGAGADAALPSFDFRQRSATEQWTAANDVREVRATAEGMEVVASGDDPFIVGPAVDLPDGAALALEMRVRSERGGAVEVFYFTDHAAAGKSVSARVAAGVWEELRLPLPPLGKRISFRIDPPATAGGRATIASMALRRRAVVKEPDWPKPPIAPAGGQAPRAKVQSGALSVSHLGAPGGIEVRVGGRLVAAGLSRSFIGYTRDGEVRWVPLPDRATLAGEEEAFKESVSVTDGHGATWRLERRYVGSGAGGAVDVHTTLAVDRDRDLLFFPAFMLLPGAGSFGTAKAQALFPGLEYLGPDDASSSEADVIGAASQRRVPDSIKVTVPLMALCAGGDFVALAWEPGPLVAAVFDSPDRTFGSGGHVMGLLLPGSDGRGRVDGALLPEVPHRMKANEPVTVRATIIAGPGRSVVPALDRYHALRGLPDVPATGMDAQAHYRWAAGGWMDSKIREGSLIRHAVWPGFGPQPAADAAVWMQWLAAQTRDDSLRKRLAETAAVVASPVPPGRRNSSAVSHVRDPAASLVLGDTLEDARAADRQARALLRRFDDDGSVRFRREAGKEDFARTNPTPTANGLTATHVARLLELAAVSGDAGLIDSALKRLRGLDRYEHDVPRGAQSWEVPLHTPDVLAAAWLVRAYVTGFELSGDRRLLELARHWAWTGVPFVYLHNPGGGQVGPYATIAVYGATNWVEPVWFGRPVQWCGLVYADALYRLAEHTEGGPWKQLADGITASGIQQSWPTSDPERQGLLPDFYHLRAQAPDGPAINPGTLQANAVRFYNGPRVYDSHRFPRHGFVVHAPGAIEPVSEDGGVVFRVRGWPSSPHEVLVSGLKGRPKVRIDGEAASDDRVSYDGDGGRLVVRLTGPATVEILGGT